MPVSEDILKILNNSGLARNLGLLHAAILEKATKTLSSQPEELSPTDYIKNALNSIGPSAAHSYIEHAVNKLKKDGRLQGIPLNGSMTHNAQLIFNSPEECPNFTNVLRQFLLPRYAYLDFDTVIDPRHHIDSECGYPKFIVPIMYRYMYDRDDVARRVVDIYPDESWSTDPIVYETDDEKENTEFEIAWQQLCDEHNVIQLLYRIDKLAGIGHYGALLVGLDDGKDLEAPVDEPQLNAGLRRPIATRRRNLLYLRPFDEYLSFIHMYETDVLKSRYGLPKFYNLVFLDMTIDAAGASIGTRLNRRVHWNRVVHVADNLQSSLVFGTPRMQPVFNRLLDLRKIKGGSAEMFWKGAFPGLSFEVDPRLVEDQPEFDRKEFTEMIERYSGGLQRYLDTVGISVKSLAPQVADPEKHVRVQMEAIASHFGVPLRIFMGSEEGRLASSQDKLTWNQRLGRRDKRFTEPNILRNFIDRMIGLGVLPPPASGRYFVDWQDRNTSTDEDKANLALKWTQALSQYVASGVIHFIQPLDYMTLILGLKPRDAIRIDKEIRASGGYETLNKVDPSVTNAGTNGVAKNNITKGSKEGTSGERPEPRNTADKQTEGSSG